MNIDYSNSTDKQKEYIDSRIDNEIYTRANELGEDIPIEDIENMWLNEGEDEYPQEIFQWFIVSEWLHGQLSNVNEPVAEYKGLYFWGRTCCGQSISLDFTFWEIFQNSLKNIA